MVKIDKLREKIVERGLSVELVAEQMGVNRSTLYRKMQNKTGRGFTVGDVRKLSEILGLSAGEITDIFFSEGVA